MLPDIPVFVDSPLAVNVTDVFRRHPEYFDDETRAYLRQDPDHDIFNFRRLRYIRDVEESKALHDLHGPCVIISASGMAEAGRIQHHLKNNIEDHRNTILIVGWQAPYTLGHRLVEQEPVVKIFGKEYRREAEVVTLNGFSGHADQPGLMEWVAAFQQRPQRTYVVHGEIDGGPDPGRQTAPRPGPEERHRPHPGGDRGSLRREVFLGRGPGASEAGTPAPPAPAPSPSPPHVGATRGSPFLVQATLGNPFRCKLGFAQASLAIWAFPSATWEQRNSRAKLGAGASGMAGYEK